MAVVDIVMSDTPFYSMSSVPNTSVEIIDPPESGLEGFRRINVFFPNGTFAPTLPLHILSMTQVGAGSSPIVSFAIHNSSITSEGAGTVLQYVNPQATSLSLHIISVQGATMI